MASRNPYSTPRNPGAASSLFSNYPHAADTDSRSRPTNGTGGYGGYSSSAGAGSGPGAYLNGSAQYPRSPGMGDAGGGGGIGTSGSGDGFRPATPNSRGQYSSSVLESLEAQNDTTQTSILSGKVSQLKQLTMAIGDEIRDSSALAERMNDNFEDTRVKLRGTMRRMLRMAERTGVGWKVWLGFFIGVWGLFAWVWLF